MKTIATILFFLTLFGCASSGDVDFLSRQVDDLKTQTDAMQKESDKTRKDVDQIKQESGSMVKEDSFAAVRESQADMDQRLSDVSSRLQELRGRFDESRFNLEKTSKDQSAEREIFTSQIAALETQVKSLNDRLTALETAGKAPGAQPQSAGQTQADASKSTAAQGEAGTAAAPSNTPDDKTAYEAAYETFKAGKSRDAREKFQAFIRNYPKSELTDNAYFWVAESYYAEKDYENAILAYETLLKKYPESAKASGAMLKQGLSFIEIGDKKTGKIILGRLVEKFPDSREAEAAKKKIDEMTKKKVTKKKRKR